MVPQIKTIKLVESNFIFKENALFERKSKAKNKFFLTFDLNYAKTWPTSDFYGNIILTVPSFPFQMTWYRCVAHMGSLHLIVWFSTAGLKNFSFLWITIARTVKHNRWNIIYFCINWWLVICLINVFVFKQFIECFLNKCSNCNKLLNNFCSMG